ncbi:MAG: sporulation protein YqfD [Clostridia bacterium]|nr:sporulation protein YqfD [Clostridia bacterium]
MKLEIIDFLYGACRMEAKGVFSERIMNIANKKGIFLRDITREDDKTITFTVSRKGAAILLSDHPDDIFLTALSSWGIPYILSLRKNRLITLLAPFAILLMLFLSTQVIWHVNVIGATGEEEEYILKELKELGVKKGALKSSIDQSRIKNRILIENPDIMWLWVDLKGSSAIVKFAPRQLPPEVYNEDEFYNIYSTHDAVITKILPKSGAAKVKEGDTVLKGQLLIEGVMPKDAENIKYIHAQGEVYGNVWEEKTVLIPKKNEIRTPTGRKTEHLYINFKNFPLKLFINSSILYTDYDIIENNRIIVPSRLSFTKKEYIEVDVTYEDNNISALQKTHESEFYTSLSQRGFSVSYTESVINDTGDSVSLTMRALCEESIAKERRINFGENNSVTDN